jgi:hypothetical protein
VLLKQKLKTGTVNVLLKQKLKTGTVNVLKQKLKTGTVNALLFPSALVQFSVYLGTV